MIAFGPDGYLYAGVGDGGGGNDPPNNAQNINTLLGKILRIDVDLPDPPALYSSPPSNPFVGVAGLDEIFSIGWRNPWRFSFDRDTGQLWVADVGQGAREEVDTPILNGGNYGWRVFEGNVCNTAHGLDQSLCVPSNFLFPIFDYTHSGGRCSITGGYVYRGTQNALPLGTYVYGDYCTGEIFSWNGTAQTVQLDTTMNISSFGEDEQGELYVVNLGGTVSKIVSTTARRRRRRLGPRRRCRRRRPDVDADADDADADAATADADADSDLDASAADADATRPRPPTPTRTSTPLPPTATPTRTSTPQPPTPTPEPPTPTPLPPTPTPTPVHVHHFADVGVVPPGRRQWQRRRDRRRRLRLDRGEQRVVDHDHRSGSRQRQRHGDVLRRAVHRETEEAQRNRYDREQDLHGHADQVARVAQDTALKDHTSRRIAPGRARVLRCLATAIRRHPARSGRFERPLEPALRRPRR